MENRLTDEHIIKALEWLVFNFPKVEKPENDSDRLCNCINLYCQNAVNELNRQKTEIERLEGILDKRCDLCPAVATAIKEFAERLRSYFNDGKDVMYLQTIIHYGIDKIVKEMEGETK